MSLLDAYMNASTAASGMLVVLYAAAIVHVCAGSGFKMIIAVIALLLLSNLANLVLIQSNQALLQNEKALIWIWAVSCS